MRPQQLEFARAVAEAIAERTHLLAEAGTGIGKSFAYLLPAVLHASEHRDRGPIVVSTRTIALQEQLEHKDLPFLKATLPLEWSAVSVVGRNHYLCLRRMHLARTEQDLLFADATQRAELQRLADWSLTTREGLRHDLPEPVRDEVWDEVRAEHGNCLNRLCKHYESCHWQRARRRLETASILIVNHALYMADVALRMAGTSYLPAHELVIFDEAHHLERIATESLGLTLTQGSLLWHLKRLHPRRARKSLLDVHGSAQAKELVEGLRREVPRFFAELEARVAATGSGTLALGEESLQDPLGPQLGALADAVLDCAGSAERVDLKTELTARANGLLAAQAVLGRLCSGAPADAGGPAHVRWLERDPRGVRLCLAPLDVSAALRQHVFGPGKSAILCSATLTAGRQDREFTWLRRQLGIAACRTLVLGSPFDYPRQVELVVEEALPDPGAAPREFAAASTQRIVAHVLANGGHALVLCTSWAFVREVEAALAAPLALAGIPLLVQGQAPLARLLQRKLQEPSSVLVGTDSLWEGIDLPGEALTLLVIARFPFAQPGHPLVEARLAAIKARGGNPFQEHSLPEAIVKFRQGFGRLIRSSTDRGRVVVLDPRARTKPYGQNFLQALPEGLV